MKKYKAYVRTVNYKRTFEFRNIDNIEDVHEYTLKLKKTQGKRIVIFDVYYMMKLVDKLEALGYRTKRVNISESCDRNLVHSLESLVNRGGLHLNGDTFRLLVDDFWIDDFFMENESGAQVHLSADGTLELTCSEILSDLTDALDEFK